MNLYQAVGNNPVNFNDPLGLIRWHGNWGGPNWTAGQDKAEAELTPEDERLPALDVRDACYKSHDISIRHDPCHIRKHDHALARCLRNISPFETSFWMTDQWMPVNVFRESIGFDTFIPYVIHK